MKKYMMQCGHYANVFDNKGRMACKKCIGHTPLAEKIAYVEED